MPLVMKSLDAATAAGAGAELMFDVPRAPNVMQFQVTGSPTGFSCFLEGTLDGTNWLSLSGSGDPTQFIVSTIPVIGIRANVHQLDGGSSPTVTATIGTKDY